MSLTTIQDAASVQKLLYTLAATPFCYILYQALHLLYHEWTSPLRMLPGPSKAHPLLGNFKSFKQMMDDSAIANEWRAKFGSVYRYRSLFSHTQLFVGDLKALSHVMNNNLIYQKAPFLPSHMERTLGHGILAVELDEHKKQRRILNQAFGVAQIRLLTETFVEKADQLRAIWTKQLVQDNGESRIDVCPWLRRLTVDIIGKAGFDYEFNSMDIGGKPNELMEVFTELLHSPNAQVQTGFRLVQSMVPILGWVPVPGTKAFLRVREKMFQIARTIFASSKASNAHEHYAAGKRDLLSILLRANMSPDVGPSFRLTDEEVVAQIPTFLMSGHETTSGSVTWGLHALSMDIAVQSKLRDELLALGTDNPSMDELNALPYLENVVREVLRIYSPVNLTQRMAMVDDVMPLGKPFVDPTSGRVYESLHIPKGQMLHIPIDGVNTDPEIWGEDAAEFRPDRWNDLPAATNAIPGVWANQMTFLTGPHNCIGFKFSLVEMKAILFVILREFEFLPAIPKGGVHGTGRGFNHPMVTETPELGSSLPLIVRKFVRA